MMVPCDGRMLMIPCLGWWNELMKWRWCRHVNHEWLEPQKYNLKFKNVLLYVVWFSSIDAHCNSDIWKCVCVSQPFEWNVHLMLFNDNRGKTLSLSLSFPSHSHMHACTCAGESGKPTGCLPHFPENSKKQFSAGLALVLARENVPPLQMVYSMPQPWQTAPPVDRLAALNTRK